MKTFLKKQNKGFTLIELMIVIAIIAILAAILIPNFIRARAQSQLAACESNLKNIATSLEMYSTDNTGNYPSQAPAVFSAANVTRLTPNYMRQIPTCPVQTQQYLYGGVNNPGAYSISQQTNLHSGYVGTAVVVGCNAIYPCYTSSGGLSIGK